MTDYTSLNLISERIHLVPIHMKYAQDICKHFTAEITQFMWPSAPKTQAEINQHIISQQLEMKNGREISMIIIDKSIEEFFGYASIHQADSKTPELGIWLKKSAHGFHYGFEALDLLKKWAENNLIYDYIKYPVDKRNIASRKLAEKLGGEIKDEYVKTSESGNLLDEVEYHFIKKKSNN